MIDFKAIEKRARAFGASRKLRDELLDDFVQEALLVAFKSKGFVNFKWVLATFARASLGDTRTPKGLASSEGRRSQLSLDAPMGDEDGAALFHEMLSDESILAPEDNLPAIDLDPKDRTFALLNFFLEKIDQDPGYTELEIGWIAL